MKIFFWISILSSSLAFTKPAEHKHREHGAHEHGAGKLGIAFEGVNGKLDFKIPSESIMGFEYAPKTEKDKKTKAESLALLENKISAMVVFESSLNCKISKEKIDVVKDEEEAKETKAEHSDTIALFNVVCEKSPAGSKISFNFQNFFSGIKDMDVQIIVDNVQKSVEAKKSGTIVELK